jgi:hypothetical protein
MNKTELLNNILAILQQAKEDKAKLQHIYDFMVEEIFEEEEEEKIEIPEKHKKLIHDIAEMIDCGHICYLNTDTMEHFDIPKSILEDLSGYDDKGLWQKELDKVDLWKNVLRFEPPEPHESFRIMERFVYHLPDENLQNKLSTALERKKPFANFKYLIDDSNYRQDWFDFKQTCLEEQVYNIFQE